MLLEGLFLPVTTPFHPGGRLNLLKLEHSIDRYSRTPAAGMIVLGAAGEASGLTSSEAAEALEAAIGLAAKHKVMLAGIGRDSVYATLKLSDAASAAGYDAAVLAAPAIPLTRLELLTYFRTIADQASLPLVMASQRGRELDLETIAELSSHPAILGLIEAGAGESRIQTLVAATAGITHEVTVTPVFAAVTRRMLKPEPPAAGSFVSTESLGGGGGVAIAPPRPALKTRTRKVGFQILAGSTAAMLEGFQSGAVGAAPPFAACAPQACYEVFQAWKDSDLPLAAEKQERLRAIAELLDGDGTVAAIKYGCDLNGYFGGQPRLPLLPLDADRKQEIERRMAGLRN
jgi:dihydrodipicolinate synthase/N-acetylneuraminate lyase